MDLSSDAELLAIYREELVSRAANLIEGAQALAAGTLTTEDAKTLFRDAHTIKGSSRVMGFEALGDAGEALEKAWRAIAEQIPEAPEDAAANLEQLAGHLVEAADEDPVKGTPRLHAMVAALTGEEPEPTPKVAQSMVSGAVESTGPAQTDLGGLLSAVERGLIGAATRVDTRKLYRLINRAAEARLDAEALSEAVRALRLAAGNPREIAALAARWESAVEGIDAAVSDLQDRTLELVATRFGIITDTFNQFVHYLGRRTGKDVRLELSGADIEVDRQILEHLREPLRHLVVNAVDHGIEPPADRARAGKPPTGRVSVRAATAGGQLVISVEDDGRGIDWDQVRSAAIARGARSEDADTDLSGLLFSPGFSTLVQANELSGDGAGLNLVADLADAVNGGVSIESTPGQGTSVLLTLPLSWAFQDMVLFHSEDRAWGIPAAAVDAVLPVAGADVRPGKDGMELTHEGRKMPIGSFSTALGLGVSEEVGEVIVLATRSGRVAMTVPEVLGRRQVAVKGLGPVLAGAPYLTGAAVLGGGEVVGMIDPNRIAERITALPVDDRKRPKVLVVDDSKGVRQLVAAVLSSQGYQVVVAPNAEEGFRHLDEGVFAALVVDFAMPGPDGVELVHAVRRRLPAMPIVMVSGVATQADQSRAWEAGVDAFLDKSDLRQGLLASTLSALLALRQGKEVEARP